MVLKMLEFSFFIVGLYEHACTYTQEYLLYPFIDFYSHKSNTFSLHLKLSDSFYSWNYHLDSEFESSLTSIGVRPTSIDPNTPASMIESDIAT